MDWKNIIAEIQSHGKLTQPQIAAECGCGQATVSDLSKGSTGQPRHSLGVALLALREKVKTDPAVSMAQATHHRTEQVAV